MSTAKSRRKGLVAAQRAADRRRRLMLISAAVGILVLLAVVIGFSLYRGQQAAVIVPPGATDSGMPVGNPGAPVTLDVYEDFQCPVCQQFEKTTGPTIDELVRAGTVRVVYHPVAFLNRFSSTEYSSRASAAAGCADPRTSSSSRIWRRRSAQPWGRAGRPSTRAGCRTITRSGRPERP